LSLLLQIGSHVNDWNLDAPELMPFWAAAEELGAAVFIHPWDMELGGRHTKFWLPWLVGMPAETCHAVVCLVMGGVLERFPDLKVCFAHGAGSFPFTVGRIEHGYNCRPDLCATDCEHPPSYYLGKFHCDSITHDAEALEFLVGKMGEDKVVFGTDYPFPLGEVTGSAKGIYPGHALDEAKNLTVEQKDKVWSSNAFAFLGLDAKDFTPSPTGHTVEVKPPTAPVPTMASTHRDDDRVVGHVAAAGAAAADASAAVAALSLAEQCDDDQSSVDSTNAAPLP
jgi:aminocarboxymuconate-semialdehyde decarboxylase